MIKDKVVKKKIGKISCIQLKHPFKHRYFRELSNPNCVMIFCSNCNGFIGKVEVEDNSMMFDDCKNANFYSKFDDDYCKYMDKLINSKN